MVVRVNIPGSVFIMDVSNSSLIPNPSRMTRHLHDTVEWINELSESNPNTISLLHRFGDEILLVARGYETAYEIAFYVIATWPFREHPPYFGVGYGDLKAEFPHSTDLERWNSPVVKRARRASNQLKSVKPAYRQWLLFDKDDASSRHHDVILNEYVLIQDRFFKLQTDVEHLVSALFTIDDLQEWIAERLNKNRSTISRQVRKSNVDLLLVVKNRVAETLRKLEQEQTGVESVDLGVQIRQKLKDRVDTIIESMKTTDV
jgi:hypothetical protein